MERVKNLLQRLQEIYYSQHQKSAIDVDLMMDYTRVLYADLLEWRKSFQEPPTRESAEKSEPVTSEAEQEAATLPPAQPAAVDIPEEKAAQQVQETPSEEEAEAPETQHLESVEEEVTTPEAEAAGESKETEETQAADNEDAQDTAGEAERVVLPEIKEPLPPEAQPSIVKRDEPAPKAPEPATPAQPVMAPEQPLISTLQRDHSGISFEPPSRPKAITELPENIEEEAPSENVPAEALPVPPAAAVALPQVKPAATPAADLFSAPAQKPPKDIRSSIGINDKYLFLNELFNNHKSNYEETLDQLNHFSNVQQAEDWIRTKVAPVNKWSDEDATVQSFYAMLGKHFSAR